MKVDLNQQAAHRLKGESAVMLLCQRMPVAEAAEILDEHDTRLWRVVCRHVEAAQAGRDWSGLKRLLWTRPVPGAVIGMSPTSWMRTPASFSS